MSDRPTNTTPSRIIDTFFDVWNPNMAYILGYFAADGCMYKNPRGSHYIAFTSTDLELITQVRNILKLSNLIESRTRFEGYKKAYTLQIGSKRAYVRLISLGLTPNKSLTLKLPDIPSKLLCHFVRGYFDGDGCASFSKVMRTDRKNRIYKQLSIRFTSGSKHFLQKIQDQLSIIIETRGSLSPRGNCYNLTFSTHDVLKLYGFLYPKPNLPYLDRKKKVIQKGIDELGSKCNGLHTSL